MGEPLVEVRVQRLVGDQNNLPILRLFPSVIQVQRSDGNEGRGHGLECLSHPHEVIEENPSRDVRAAAMIEAAQVLDHQVLVILEHCGHARLVAAAIEALPHTHVLLVCAAKPRRQERREVGAVAIHAVDSGG